MTAHEVIRLMFHDAIGFSQSGEFEYVLALHRVEIFAHFLLTEDMALTVP